MPIAIVVELGNLGALADVHQGEVMAALREAAFRGARFAQDIWIKAAQTAQVRGTGAYIRGIEGEGSIRVGKETAGGEDKDWEILIEVVNTAPHASIVEEGHAAFHLPSVIRWGSGRTKKSKKGGYYMHVAFRHAAFEDAAGREAGGFTPATIRRMMPQDIHTAAKRLRYTQRLGQGPITGPAGEFVQADRYKWGNRLDRSNVRAQFVMGGPGAPNAGGPGEPGFEERRGARQVGRDQKGNPLINPGWQSSKFHGLFKAGSKGSPQYMTIRTMTDHSLGWNIPAQSGKFIAAKVATILQSDDRFAETVLAGLTAATLPGAP